MWKGDSDPLEIVCSENVMMKTPLSTVIGGAFERYRAARQVLDVGNQPDENPFNVEFSWH